MEAGEIRDLNAARVEDGVPNVGVVRHERSVQRCACDWRHLARVITTLVTCACCPAWLSPCCRKGHCAICALSTYAAIILGLVPMLLFFSFPPHLPYKIVPQSLGISSFEYVTFPSVDPLLSRSVEIAAVYYPSQKPDGCPQEWLAKRGIANTQCTIIAQHGLSGAALAELGHPSVARMAVKPLLCAGFSVLTPDMRNHGRSSDARPITAGYQEANDVLVAAQWLVDNRNATRERLFLWGESLGAATVSYAASRDTRFRALAIEAPPVSCGLVFGGFAKNWPYWVRTWFAWWHKTLSLEDPYNEALLREARFITADVLHSHGYEDPVVPFENAKALRLAFEGRGASVEATGAIGAIGGLRRPSYKHFFHHGGHTSSWKFDEYFTMMLEHFSNAANTAPPALKTGGMEEPRLIDEFQIAQKMRSGWV